MKRLLLAGALLACAGANAATYQVGQYLGNFNDAGRFAYNTMGGAAQYAPYSTAPTYTAAANGVRMAGTASATIGGRVVPLTLLSRIPASAVATAARGLALTNPATAAVTLLGFAAMNGWLTPAGLEWNMDPATNREKPFLIEQPFIGDPLVFWLRNDGFVSPSPQCSGVDPNSNEGVVYCTSNGVYNGVFFSRHVLCSGGYVSWGAGQPRPPCAPPPGFKKVPATWDEAAPKLAQTAPPDPNIVPELLKRGASFPQPVDQTLSGPSSQPGEKTTRQNADGTTTTTQTTHNYTYNQGNTTNNTTTNITHNTTTTTIITNQAGEEVGREEETTEPEPKEPETASDTPLPTVPDFYEQKYPDGIAGVWEKHKAGMSSTSLMTFAGKVMPTGFGAGSCPQWSLPVDVGWLDAGSYDISIPCEVWQACKVIMLIGALLLARRLVFGG